MGRSLSGTKFTCSTKLKVFHFGANPLGVSGSPSFSSELESEIDSGNSDAESSSDLASGDSSQSSSSSESEGAKSERQF